MGVSLHHHIALCADHVVTLRTWRHHYDRHVTTINGLKMVTHAYICDDTEAWAALSMLTDYKVNTIADGVVFLIPR